MSFKHILLILFTFVGVVSLSILSVSLWGGKPEELELSEINIASINSTLGSIGAENHLPPEAMAKAFELPEEKLATTSLSDLGIGLEAAKTKIGKAVILYQEHQSKNWLKILIKFIMWFGLLPIPVIFLVKKRMSPSSRKLWYLAGVLVFGIILGSDPSPMGTVKDAVYLISAHQTVFWPRMIALAVFLLTVVLANKLICSWGCQFGLFQDFLFRLNRRKKDRKGIIRQYKVPFWITNTVRISLFVLFILVGVAWSVDFIGYIDPFKIFNPMVVTVAGGIFIAVVAVASLFVYRPWCHFACPFGLVSWFFEKLSVFRIKVNYNKCDACDACSASCPSTVMDAILKKDKVIPDCFACGVCIETCPTDAISFTSSKKDEGTYADSLEIRKQKLARTT